MKNCMTNFSVIVRHMRNLFFVVVFGIKFAYEKTKKKLEKNFFLDESWKALLCQLLMDNSPLDIDLQNFEINLLIEFFEKKIFFKRIISLFALN